MSTTRSYQSLGHLGKAPLVYTVAMVEYAPIPRTKMEVYSEDILESLRSTYPDIGEYAIQTWDVTFRDNQQFQAQERTEKNWRLNNVARTWGVSLNENRLILQTTNYKHFPEFAEKLAEVLRVVVEKARITHTRKLGIRYIDNIKTIGQLSVEEQIKSEFLSPKIAGDFKPIRSRMEHVYKSREGTLFFRCYGLKNLPGIPQDLVPVAQELIGPAQPILPISETFALVDTDHQYSPDAFLEIDIEAVLSKLDTLHQGASMAFREAVTKDGLNAWGWKNDA